MKLRPMLLALVAVALSSSAASAEMLSVKVPTANFRAGPSTQQDISFSATKYYPVKVLKKEAGWCKIVDFEGDEAWVAERLLSRAKTIVVAVPHANMREKPTTKSGVVFKVERGEVFKIEKREGRWLFVRDAKGESGWIREDLAWGMKKPAQAEKKDG